MEEIMMMMDLDTISLFFCLLRWKKILYMCKS